VIEERVKKMKLKVLHSRPIKGSVFIVNKDDRRKKKNRYISKTISFDEKDELRYRSLSVAMSVDDKYIKLPKIKKGN